MASGHYTGKKSHFSDVSSTLRPRSSGALMRASTGVVKSTQRRHSAPPSNPEKLNIHPEELVEENCTCTQLQLAIKAARREDEREALTSRFSTRRIVSAPPGLPSQRRQCARGATRFSDGRHTIDVTMPPRPTCKRRKYDRVNSPTQPTGSVFKKIEKRRTITKRKNNILDKKLAVEDLPDNIRKTLDIDTRITMLEIRVRRMKQQSEALVRMSAYER